MKKIFVLFFVILGFLKAAPSLDELEDFTPLLAIRSLETGISLSPFRYSSQKLEEQNWFLKEIVLSEELKAKDRYAKQHPFGYVQFINPKGNDVCLAVLNDKAFGTKSCKQDLQDGMMQTVFSIMPTTNASVQIRSLTNGGVKCMSTFADPNIAIENRFGLDDCTVNPSVPIELRELFFFSPAIVEATPIY
ncbi:cytolethal distending toxin subunit A [Campylobacter lari]|nr:cytolethal distending toxin subunit A [Campylobacter lari]EAI7263484.1 cytolethal distending toxin subunit A [Campylobacter lari]EGK7522306.1 cytolethal distending toxin subunit A [Campylobacter lari]EGK7523473.1 cytolethal distending toxin subunit A [Campylobacter lari]EGK8076114.1 cytolethal distending toxin subunit A [Campylobacter lari]